MGTFLKWRWHRNGKKPRCASWKIFSRGCILFWSRTTSLLFYRRRWSPKWRHRNSSFVFRLRALQCSKYRWQDETTLREKVQRWDWSRNRQNQETAPVGRCRRGHRKTTIFRGALVYNLKVQSTPGYWERQTVSLLWARYFRPKRGLWSRQRNSDARLVPTLQHSD